MTVLNNGQRFIELPTIHRPNVAGIPSANQFDLTASSAGVGTIYAGIVTAGHFLQKILSLLLMERSVLELQL